jgi:hypothetical protein
VNVPDVTVTLLAEIAPPELFAEHPVNVPDVTVTLPPVVYIAPPTFAEHPLNVLDVTVTL